MSRYNLAMSTFCMFLGISLLMFAFLISPRNASADTGECMTKCMKDTGCMSKCMADPNSQECKDCQEFCTDKCASMSIPCTMPDRCDMKVCFATSQSSCSTGNDPKTGKCFQIGILITCVCYCALFFDETTVAFCKCQL